MLWLCLPGDHLGIIVAIGKGGAWTLHYASGYAILTLVLFRILWGFFGSENARFAHVLKSPVAALRQLARLTTRDVDRETSHNPAGGWMVVALLALLFRHEYVKVRFLNVLRFLNLNF